MIKSGFLLIACCLLAACGTTGYANQFTGPGVTHGSDVYIGPYIPADVWEKVDPAILPDVMKAYFAAAKAAIENATVNVTYDNRTSGAQDVESAVDAAIRAQATITPKNTP